MIENGPVRSAPLPGRPHVVELCRGGTGPAAAQLAVPAGGGRARLGRALLSRDLVLELCGRALALPRRLQSPPPLPPLARDCDLKM